MEAAAIKVGEEIVAGVGAQIKHQFSYLSQYHDNVQNLSSKVETLNFKRRRMEERVEEARRNSHDIEDDVNNWLAKVEVVKAEAEAILKDKDKVGNGCWKGWCLNLKLRYWLSRKAVKETLPKLDALLAEVDQFVIAAIPQLPLGVVYVPTRNSEIMQATSDNKKCFRPAEIQGDEKSDNIASYNAAEHVPEGIASSSLGTCGGLESRLLILGRVMEAVKDDQIRIVRICGMGGVGKTTMTKEVEKIARAGCLFHEIATAEFNQEPDLKSIQLHIAELIGLELKEDKLSTRADRLRARLNDKNKMVLVILDNVWRREDLEEVGIPLGDEQRCKILLTSRLDSICKNIAPEKEFKIEVLSDPEARILFRQCLGNSPCYDQIAEELVKACAGLPIAIKSIARAVANKEKVEWTVALTKLHKSALEGEYPAVFNCLKVSYDFLKSEEIKKFFRLCCLFRKGFNVSIEDLARYGMALRLFKDIDKLYEARDEAHRNVETLLHSNLLLGSDQKECVKVHDHVWDFAMSTSSNGLFMVNYSDGIEEWPRRDSYEDYTSISLLCSEMDAVPEGLNCRNLTLLQLTGDQGTRSLKFPENFYERMGGLSVLAFRSMNVSLTPKSLQLLSNLRTLSLKQCSLGGDVSMIGNLDKLEVLSFAYSDITFLPAKIGKLKGLRLLDLTMCRRLYKIAPGVFSRLICLEELYLRGTGWWLESQTTVTEISSLSKLGVLDIEIPYEVLPMDSLFAKLKKFKISVDKYRRSQGEYLFENNLDLRCDSSILLQDGIKLLLRETERMDLTVMGLKTLLDDSETLEFSNLKSLALESCNELVHLINMNGNPHQNNVFRVLDSLYLKKLPSLEDICHFRNSSESFFELTRMHSAQLAPFCNLKVLDVKGCDKLECIFTLSAARGLMMLERIKIHRCDKLKVIFCKERGDEDENVAVCKIEFHSLKYLSLKGLPNLVRFCEARAAVEFPHLVDLKLNNLPLLTSIHPETETSASGLNASSGNPLFNQKGPHKVWRLRNLRSLKLTFCSSLRHLSTLTNAISFEELEHLEVKSCESLQAIVAEKEEEEEDCARERIIFPKLNHLVVSELPNLSTFMPNGYTLKWSSLKRMEVVNCGGESTIFVNKNSIHWGNTGRKFAMTSLEGMQIKGTDSTELWRNHFPGGFSYELRTVRIFHCDTPLVLFFPRLVRGFHHLEDLDLEKCESLEVVFDHEELIVGGGEHKVAVLKKLNCIQICDLPRMTHVWKKVPKNFEGGFHNLTSIKIEKCDSLKYLFSPSIAKCLVKLKLATIENCGVMEEVVSKRDEEGDMGQKDAVDKLFFPQLQELMLSDLSSLMCFGLAGACVFDKLSLETHHEGNANTSISFPIFNEKIALTILEDLEIRRTNSMEGFSYGLRSMIVDSCNKLPVLFPAHLIQGFNHLEKLGIKYCDNLEVVFDLEELNVEVEHKVVSILNQLYEMSLYNLPSMTNVWKKVPKDFEGGFHNITSLKVDECGSLRYLFSPSIAKCLVKLEKVHIQKCEEMEEVVSKRDEEGEEDKRNAIDMILFPKLEQLELKDLPSLICLGPAEAYAFGAPNVGYDVTHDQGDSNSSIPTPIINEKIALTSTLEEMENRGTNSMELRRDHFAGGFSYGLRNMIVDSCNKLLVLFPPHLIQGFPNLEKFDIRKCHTLEVVFDLEELTTVGGKHKLVMLKRLADMRLSILPRMTHVWKKVPKDFRGGFHNVTSLEVLSCDSLRYLFSPLIAKCLVKLRKLSTKDCEVIEEVVSERDEEGEVHKNLVDMIFFPELHELEILNLPSLTCLGPAGAYAFDKLSVGAPNVETHAHGNAHSSISTPVFNGKLSFSGPQSSNPASSALRVIGRCQLSAWSLHNLTRVKVYRCHKLLSLFPPHIVVRLPVLQHLSIEECDSLKYVFSSSTVTSLVQLRDLEIIECEMMEVIVLDEKNDEAADKMNNLVFPSLISLTLRDLPNLGGICLGMPVFEWPSLTSVGIEFCWKMGIFTCGYSSTPILDGVLIDTIPYILEEGDLNTTLKSVKEKDHDNLAFKEEGILTINGFFVAGDHLVAQCPSWSWESGEPWKRNHDLPSKRQFLITKNVPCLRRARASSSTAIVVEDKNEADDECADEKNIARPRTYDVSITYDIRHQTARLWLAGYDEETKMILPLKLVLEDIAELHPRELVNVDDHPHMPGTHVSFRPGLLPSFINSDNLTLQGFQPNVHHYLQLLLVSHASHMPTIQYRFR